MIKKRSGLALQIALPFALLLVITLGGLSLYLSSFIQKSYLDLLKDNLQSETRLIADRITPLMQSGPDATTIENRVKADASLLGARITIIDPTGKVIGDSTADPLAMENHLTRPEVALALQGQVSTELRYSNTLQTQMLYAAAPIKNNSQIIGVARLAVSLETIQRNESNLLRTVSIATLVAALLAILLAILIAAYTVRPIKKLTGMAQEIAEGKQPVITTPARHDEVGQLQQSILWMSQQLNQQINDLRTGRGMLEAVLANMTDGVIMVNADGKVQLINPAALHLFKGSEEQTLDRPLVEAVRNYQLVDLWQKSQETGVQQITTFEMAPDHLFIQAIATPLETSLPGMTLLVVQDLTRLHRLETVRQDFVSNVSHELRTPLASLKALAETLEEGAIDDPPAAHRFLQRMITEIDNLTQMVHELLELSRIESNKVPLQRSPVQPCEIARSAVERMQLQAERAGLTLALNCSAELPPVLADAGRVEQVLVNLIHNAIKFTQPGGSITVYTKRDEKVVTFAVCDTGVGISEEMMPRIFERFYKGDRARSGGGTGLGLSIARHIVEAHGGRIWAESKVNQGSTFYFTLPIV